MPNEEVLRGLPAVQSVVVNMATGRATVEYDASRVNLGGMSRTVSDVGRMEQAEDGRSGRERLRL